MHEKINNCLMKSFIRLFVILLLSLVSYSAMGAITASVSLDSGAPGSIYPTQETRFELTISNTAPVQVSGLGFNLTLPGTLPAGLKVNGTPSYTCTTPGLSASAGSGTLTASVGSQSISLTGGIIPAHDNATSVDGYCTIVIPVTAGSSSVASLTFNIASNAISGNDGTAQSNSGAVSQSLNILTLSKYSIAETTSPSSFHIGSDSTVSIRVTNPNTIAITGVGLKDTIATLTSTPIALVSANPNSSVSCTSGTPPSFSVVSGASFVTIAGASIPASSSCTFSFKVTGSYIGSAVTRNQVNSISNVVDDLSLGSNTPTYSTYTVTSPLSVSAAYQSNSMIAGASNTLTLTLSNASATAISNVSFIKSSLFSGASGLSVTSTSNSGTCAGVSYTATGFEVSGATIPASSNCTIVIAFTVGNNTGTSSNNYAFSGAAGSISNAQGIYHNGYSATTLTVSTPLTVSESWASSAPYAYEADTLTITLTNTGADALSVTNFAINSLDGLSGTHPDYGLTISSVSGGVGCGTFASTLTNSNYGFAVSSASVPAKVGGVNGTCVITVNFTGKLSNSYYGGPYTHTISAGAITLTNASIISGSATPGSLYVYSPIVPSLSYYANGSTTSAISTLVSGDTGRIKINLRNYNSSISYSNLGFTVNPLLSLRGTQSSSVSNLSISAIDASACTGASASSSGGSITISGLSLNAASNCNIWVDFSATPTSGASTTLASSYIVANAITATASNGILTYGQPADTYSGYLTLSDTLRLTLTQTPGSYSSSFTGVAPGNPVKYTLAVSNYDNANAGADFKVTDSLPSGYKFLTGVINGHDFTPTVSGTSCGTLSTTSSAGDASAVLLLSSIPIAPSDVSPSTCTITFWAMVKTDALLTNYNAVNDNTINSGAACLNTTGPPCNSQAASTTSHQVRAPMSVLVSISDPTYSNYTYSGTARLTITLYNYTQNDLTGVNFSSALATSGAGNLRVSANPNVTNTCGGSVGATPNSTTLSGTGMTVTGRATNGTSTTIPSCTIAVNVSGDAGASYLTYTQSIAVSTAASSYADGTTAPALVNVSGSASFTFYNPLTATLSFSPSSVVSGKTTTATITLTNTYYGPTTITGITVNNSSLPTGMVIATPSNARTSCSGVTVITDSSGASVDGASSIKMTGATLPRNASCQLVYDVVENFASSSTTSVTNSIASGNILADNNIKTAAVSAVLLQSAATPTTILISQNAEPSTLTFPGQISTLQLTLTNGTTAVSQLNMTEYFTGNGLVGGTQLGVEVAPTPAISTTCDGAVVSASAGGRSIGLSGVSLTANQSCVVNVNVLSTVIGGVTLVIPSNAISTSQGITNASAATTSISTGNNIGVTTNFTPNVVTVNQRSRLRITYYNPTTLPMTSLAMTNNLPLNLTVPAGPNVISTCAGATVATTSTSVSVSGGTISFTATGALTVTSCYVELDVSSAVAANYTNVITSGAVSAGSNSTTTSNSQPASDVLRVVTPISIQVAIGSSSGSGYKTLDTSLPSGWATGTYSSALLSIASGSSFTGMIKLRVTNSNNSALTGSSFSFSLPSGLLLSSSPNAQISGTGCQATIAASAYGASLSLSAGVIPASTTCEITAYVYTTSSGSYSFSVPANFLSNNEGVSNADSSSALLLIYQRPTVASTFTPSVIAPTGTSVLNVVLGNLNASAISVSSTFTNTLPTGLKIASPNGLTATGCAGTITATAGATSFTYSTSSSQITAITGCSISLNVTPTDSTSASVGDYINYIAAEALSTSAGMNLTASSSILTVSASAAGYISGRVFIENAATPNSSFNQGSDAPINGATVSLYAGSSCSGTPTNTTTDSLGNFSFQGLAANTYSICQASQPTGTINGQTVAGSDITAGSATGSSGTASNPTSSTSSILGIVLGTDGTSVSSSSGNNFSELVTSSISGKVFSDTNNNGVENGSELGIPSVTITLTGTDYLGGAVSESATTNGSGAYSFTALLPGSYTVTQASQPSNTTNGLITGTVLTMTNTTGVSGVLGTLSNPTGTSSAIASITLPPNTAATKYNFPELPGTRSIMGAVILDQNDDGAVGLDEGGISGVVIELSGTDIASNSILLSATTASDGTFSFSNLPEGTYTLTETTQPTSTTDGETIKGNGSSGSPTTSVTAKNTTPSKVINIYLTGSTTTSADNYFLDVPVSSSDLIIYTISSLSSTTSSTTLFDVGSNVGSFTLTPKNIGSASTSGTISLAFTAPTGMSVASGTGSGWTCATVGQVITCSSSDVIAQGSLGQPVVIAVGVNSDQHGEVLTASASISGGAEPVGFQSNNGASKVIAIVGTGSISGKVFYDRNHNKILDVSDTALANYVVKLFYNGALYATAVSDSTGAYVFNNIAENTNYQIRIFKPNGTTPAFGFGIPNESGQSFTDGVVGSNNPAGASTIDGNLNQLSVSATQVISEQSFALPLDPSGIIYDSSSKAPLAGVVIRISGPAGFTSANVVGGSVDQTTGADGVYQFLLTSDAPAGTYTLSIVSVPSGYRAGFSTNIPVCSATLTAGSTPSPAAVYLSSSVPPDGTILRSVDCPTLTSGLGSGLSSSAYYESFNLTPGTSADVINNQIPIDLDLPANIIYKKTVDKASALVSDTSLVYTIALGNSGGSATGTTFHVYDQLPTGVSATAVSAGNNVSGVTCTNMSTAGALLDCTVTSTAISAGTALTDPGVSTFTITTTVPATPATITNYIQVSSSGGTVVSPAPASATCSSPSVCSVDTVVSEATATLTLAKVASAKNVELGDSVMYTLTLRHVAGGAQTGVAITDTLPLGFRYIPNTVKVTRTGSSSTISSGDAAVGVTGVGPTLNFTIGNIVNGDVDTITYRVRVGVGAAQGTGINKASARSASGVSSNEASVKVKVDNGVFAQEGCIIGKVYLDCNGNGVQDRDNGNEPGIGGVRIYTEDGTYMISDPRGSYSLCGVSAMTHVLKLDQTTLPPGAKLGISANRNAGDPDSIFVDMKFGELHRADFIINTCTPELIERLDSPALKQGTLPPNNKRPSKTKVFSSKEQNESKQNSEGAR